MKIIKPFNEDYSLENEQSTKVFLAGTVAGTNWRETFFYVFRNKKYLVFYNPIYDNYLREKEACNVWIFDKLKKSNIIIFWFNNISDNSLSLYELGNFINSDKSIFIGIENGYKYEDEIKIFANLYSKKIYPSIDSIMIRLKMILGDYDLWHL
jgi:hypothetical protein